MCASLGGLLLILVLPVGSNLGFTFDLFGADSSNIGQCVTNGNIEGLILDPVAQNSVAQALDTINKTFVCNNISATVAQPLLGKLYIYFFYGPNANDSYIVPISEVTNLLTHPRWDANRSMVMYMPGWRNSLKNPAYSLSVIQAYYQVARYNFMALDWYNISGQNYLLAAGMVSQVGEAVAVAVKELQKNAQWDHIVGHSLGAHVAGHVGRNLPTLIRLFVALEPAGLLFYKTMFGCYSPIVSTDAERVLVMHTDWNKLGCNEIVGTVDFLPNGGMASQPGCSSLDTQPSTCTSFCSHVMAVRFWSAGISQPGTLLGRKCESWNRFQANKCSNSTIEDMLTTTQSGLYFLTTSSVAPYLLGPQGV